MAITSLSLASSADTHSDPPIGRPAGYVTRALIAINVLIFLAMVVSGVGFLSPGPRQVLPWGANFGPLTTSGQWWRLVTACFLHFGILHVAMNMFVLFFAGFIAEALYGRVRYTLLYLLAGIGGNVAGLYLHPHIVSAGASGAIFGLYGGLLAFLLVHRGVLPKSAIASTVKSAVLFIVFNLLYGLRSPTTDMEAHIGGLLTGFVVGLLLSPSVSVGGTSPSRSWTYGGIGGSLAGIAIAIVLLPRSSPGETAWARAILFDPHVMAGPNHILFYDGGITRVEAARSAPILDQIGLFTAPDIDMLLSKDPSGVSLYVGFSADESRRASHDSVTSRLENGKTVIVHTSEAAAPFPWNDPKVLGPIRGFGPRIAAAAGGGPLTVRLLNGTGQLRNQVPIDDFDLVVGTADHISYNAQAGSQRARAVGAALQASGFFSNRGGMVVLHRGADGTDLIFPLRDDAWDSVPTVAAMQAVTRRIAPAAGGFPIRAHLADLNFQDKKVLLVTE